MSKPIVIVDIDGTISKVGKRIKYLQCEPKDWDSFYNDCFQDEPIKEICDLVKNLSKEYYIVFCTGRRECVRTKTEFWIRKNLGDYFVDQFPILMRPNGDKRHDTILKPEMISRYGIRPNMVSFVLEDRDLMVAKWRELGLICLQVAEGDF